MKVRFAVAAALVATSFVAVEVSAQSSQAPAMTPLLAGKKLTPPVRGQAEVDFTQPKTVKKGGDVVTTIKVKNTSAAPIARLKIIETWFDANNATVPGGEGVVNGLLNPGEVTTIEIHTPWSDKLKSNSWNFVHANCSVKPHKVASLDEKGSTTAGGKEPAAKTAAAAKPAPKKK